MRVTAPSDPFTRSISFLDAYLAAPDDADIEFRIGADERGTAAVLVSINSAPYGFTSKEARIVADIFESALNAHPKERDAKGLPNAIMGLRAAADAADRAISKTTS